MKGLAIKSIKPNNSDVISVERNSRTDSRNNRSVFSRFFNGSLATVFAIGLATSAINCNSGQEPVQKSQGPGSSAKTDYIADNSIFKPQAPQKATRITEDETKGVKEFKPGEDFYTLNLPGGRYLRVRYLGKDEENNLAKFIMGFGKGVERDFLGLDHDNEFTVPLGKTRTLGEGVLNIEVTVAKFGPMFKSVRTKGWEQKEVEVSEYPVFVSVKGPSELRNFVKPGQECKTLKPVITVSVDEYMFNDVHFNRVDSDENGDLGFRDDFYERPELSALGNSFVSKINLDDRVVTKECRDEQAKWGDIVGTIRAINKKNGISYAYTRCATQDYSEEDVEGYRLVKEPPHKKVGVVVWGDPFELSAFTFDSITGAQEVVTGRFMFCPGTSHNTANIVRSCTDVIPNMNVLISNLHVDVFGACIKPESEVSAKTK